MTNRQLIHNAPIIHANTRTNAPATTPIMIGALLSLELDGETETASPVVEVVTTTCQ